MVSLTLAVVVVGSVHASERCVVVDDIAHADEVRAGLSPKPIRALASRIQDTVDIVNADMQLENIQDPRREIPVFNDDGL